MKNENSEKLFSPQVEKELQVFEGRGSRSPRAYISSKSCLPKVLLTSNPLIERDLQRELASISSDRSKRQKVWEWNQRHFLVSQIFDPEFNLRFTKEVYRFNSDLTEDELTTGKQPNEKPNRKKSLVEVEGNGGRRKSRTGLGVFMPPLHPSQRLIEKAKIPNQMLSTGTSEVSGRKKTNLHARRVSVSDADDLIKMTGNSESKRNLNQDFTISSDKKYRSKNTIMTKISKRNCKSNEKHGNFPNLATDHVKHRDDFVTTLEENESEIPSPAPLLRRQNTYTDMSSPSQKHIIQGNLAASDVTQNNGKNIPEQHQEQLCTSPPSSAQRKVSKSVSLPEIPIYRSKTLHFPTDKHLENCAYTSDSSSDASKISSEVESGEEVLCHADVLAGVTRTLPVSIMIKANQNINRKVAQRRQVMIQQCERERDRDIFSDPRWLELRRMLVDGDRRRGAEDGARI